MNFKKNLKRFMTLDRHHAEGFTLVELIVVIAILAILGGVALPAYNGYIKKTKISADDTLLAALNTAYTSACTDNGEYDMKKLSFSPKAEVTETGVTMSKFDDAFQRFYAGNGAFQYYDKLFFVKQEGVFTGANVNALAEALAEAWGNSSYKEALLTLLKTFDGIGAFFANAAGMDMSFDTLLSNVPTALADALGLSDMFGGFNESINLSDEEMEAYLREKYGDEYDNMSEEQKTALKAQMKGNAAVMHFASDAAGRSVEDVKNSVYNLMNMLGATQTMSISDQDVIDYYASTLDPNSAEYQEFMNNPNQYDVASAALAVNSLGSDAAFDAKAVVAMAKYAEESGTSNTAGASTLGAMYALAAGFYESDYYTGTTTPNLGEFSSVSQAMSDPAFQTYLNECGDADLEAYLACMTYLSTGDVEMDSADAFTGQSGYIEDAIG